VFILYPQFIDCSASISNPLWLILLISLKPSLFEAWIEQYYYPIDRGDVGLIVVLIKLLPAAINIGTEVKLKLSVFNRRR
jgi:hypothetical protein